MAKAKAKERDPQALVRESAGRYRSGDGRFTVEQESAGSWVVVDDAQANELGLPLVRGPFATLAGARSVVAQARSAPAPASPLEERLKAAPDPTASRAPARRDRPEGRHGAEASRPRGSSPTRKPPQHEEPAWLSRLEPAERRRAGREIEALQALDVRDASEVVRRDVSLDIPAVAHVLLARRAGADAAAAVARAVEGGIPEPDARRLATDVLAAAFATIEVGRDTDAPGSLPGWRLVETGRGRDREIRLSASDLALGDGPRPAGGGAGSTDEAADARGRGKRSRG